jgi:hypothetical protein
MKPRRWALTLGLAALVVCCIPSALIAGAMHKTTDARWETCGVGDREVRSLASDGKRLFAAVNQPGHGDVMTSSDGCMNFNPSMLTTEVVWSVAWFADEHLLCAGARDQLYCGAPTHLRATTVKQDVYYVVERDGVLVTGGYPSVFSAPADTLAFTKVATLPYASSAATVTAESVLVSGDQLRALDVQTGALTTLQFGLQRAGALAARGQRVYVAGSHFEFSDDGGKTFTLATLPGTQPEVIVMPTENPDVVLVGTHGDVRRGDAYLSRDRGQTWDALGCPGSEIHALLVDEKYVYCGATALTGTKGLWRIPRAAIGL